MERLANKDRQVKQMVKELKHAKKSLSKGKIDKAQEQYSKAAGLATCGVCRGKIVAFNDQLDAPMGKEARAEAVKRADALIKAAVPASQAAKYFKELEPKVSSISHPRIKTFEVKVSDNRPRSLRHANPIPTKKFVFQEKYAKTAFYKTKKQIPNDPRVRIKVKERRGERKRD